MDNVINLRQQRKAKKRGEKEKTAEQNRLKYGRTKQEKQKEKSESARARKHIDGHKREKDEES